MTKRMSASDAKNRWGELVRTVVDHGQTVVVESRREPLLVVMSPQEFEELQLLRREKVLREARESLVRIQEIQSERTKNLSPEEADAIIEQIMEEDRAERTSQAVRSSNS